MNLNMAEVYHLKYIFFFNVSWAISLLSYFLNEIQFSFLHQKINGSLASKISQPNTLDFCIAKNRRPMS